MRQILCFGDSNTYGLIPGTKDRYDWDTRWSGQIGQRLWEDGCRIVERKDCADGRRFLMIRCGMADGERSFYL